MPFVFLGLFFSVWRAFASGILSLVIACCWLAVLFGSSVAQAVPHSSDTAVTEPDDNAANLRPNDFFVTRRVSDGTYRKYLTFGDLGWASGLVQWRYDDTNRPAGLAVDANVAIAKIQTAMNKWSVVCNVQFSYLGVTSLGPSLAPPTQNLDSANVIGWRAMGFSGITGVTGLGSSSSNGGPFRIVEGDIAINYHFNPNVDVTLLHEIGHLIGLRHSNVEGTVMSGPNPSPLPSTEYAPNVITLQPDDIAGCVSMYGQPAATTRTINGVVSASPSGFVSGVLFHARPASGVTCDPSNSAGEYSCTVPNGWAGVLHSPSVSGQRIPPQSFTAVSVDTTRNVAALAGVPACNLDVDDNGLFEPEIDGVAISRRMAGFNVAGFSGLFGAFAANTTAASVYAATSSNYNVTQIGGGPRLLADGLIIERAMKKLTGTAVTNGATNIPWATLQSWLNTNCGTTF